MSGSAEPGPQPGRPSPSSKRQEDSGTGFPFFRSWPAVYGFVLAVWTLWIVLLAAFMRTYS
jgi:hypothetical protein